MDRMQSKLKSKIKTLNPSSVEFQSDFSTFSYSDVPILQNTLHIIQRCVQEKCIKKLVLRKTNFRSSFAQALL